MKQPPFPSHSLNLWGYVVPNIGGGGEGSVTWLLRVLLSAHCLSLFFSLLSSSLFLPLTPWPEVFWAQRTPRHQLWALPGCRRPSPGKSNKGQKWGPSQTEAHLSEEKSGWPDGRH